MALEDILIHRNAFTDLRGHNSIWFVELFGGKVITYTAFEPDPNTHRDEYYYNVNDNALYKKQKINKNTYVWKRVSQ